MWPLGTYGDPNLLGNATARGVEVITILDNYNDGALGVPDLGSPGRLHRNHEALREELATFSAPPPTSPPRRGRSARK